jgi:sarcosine oxidase gamma subunit
MLAGGSRRLGERVLVHHLGSSIAADVVKAPFIDPAGERLHGRDARAARVATPGEGSPRVATPGEVSPRGSAADADGIVVDGLAVKSDRNIRVLALRHLTDLRPFSAYVHSFLGAALPAPRIAVTARGGLPPRGRERRTHDRWILAWRSPTETWMLCAGEAETAELHARMEGMKDVCVVDQTGGIAILAVRGERTDDLLVRLGSAASVPALGEARTSRMAEITVMALRVDPDELLLLFDQAQLGHVLGWIEVTARDFSPTRPP